MKSSRNHGWVLAAIVFALVLPANNAFAAIIGGSTSGIFVNPTVVPPMALVTTGVGTSSFSWGTGYYSDPSSLEFTGKSVATDFDTRFSFGKLSYFNGQILGNTGANTVDLRITLSLTAPVTVSKDFDFTLSLINTPNLGLDPDADADYVIFPTSLPSTSFSYEGVDYTLTFLDFGRIGDGGFAHMNEFHVWEGHGDETNIYGKIARQERPIHPVPEPGTMMLLGSGLVGLAGFGRKRSKK